MGFTESMRRFFGQMAAVPDMARAEVVAHLVPAGARYVTVGPIAVLPDVRAFNGGEPGAGPRGLDLGYLPAGFRQEVALLVLTGDRLLVVGRSGPRWECETGHLIAVDGGRRGGFLVFTRGPQGLAVGQQTPVQVPPGASFGTVRGMTTIFSGWDTMLAPYGVQRHF